MKVGLLFDALIEEMFALLLSRYIVYRLLDVVSDCLD
jgi:hypothetical protein